MLSLLLLLSLIFLSSLLVSLVSLLPLLLSLLCTTTLHVQLERKKSNNNAKLKGHYHILITSCLYLCHSCGLYFHLYTFCRFPTTASRLWYWIWNFPTSVFIEIRINICLFLWESLKLLIYVNFSRCELQVAKSYIPKGVHTFRVKLRFVEVWCGWVLAIPQGYLPKTKQCETVIGPTCIDHGCVQ